MDYVHSTTSERKKGSHLRYEDRCFIQLRLHDGWSANRIAKELGCAPNTVRNEIKRGTVLRYRGQVKRYKAEEGQSRYKEHRKGCGRKYALLEKQTFLAYVQKQFWEEKWSLDACVGRAHQEGLFPPEKMVSTRTLYRYVDLGLLSIRNIDLTEKVKRSTKKKRNRQNKRVLGRSISERPSSVENREAFGHWEADLVLGSREGTDHALLTLLERKTRQFWMLPIPGKRAQDVMKALEEIRQACGARWNQIFKTITTDNGSEFSLLSNVERVSETLVYFAHPYTSCEKGSIERHNGLIRRFLPKGRRMDQYTMEHLAKVEAWCNSLPRKILGYKTPDELFQQELANLSQQTA